MRLSVKDDMAVKTREGYKKMKGASVAVCGIVKNCAGPLGRSIPVLEKLRSCFRRSFVVVFENDSTDGTKELLKEWGSASPGVNIVTNDTGVNVWPAASAGGVHPAYSFHRISRMAGFRNQYLEYVEKNLDVDYLIVLDLDLLSISIDGIANTFGQPVEWDAVSSNGRSVPAWRELWEGYRYYDTYAFRESGDERPQTQEMIMMYQKTLRYLRPGMPMLRVASGFNGMAVYSWPAVKGLRYGCDRNNDRQVEVEVEHYHLHRQMALNKHDRIYVNPAQTVFYNSYAQFFTDAALGPFKDLLNRLSAGKSGR